jgi:SiaC family regulatory phosphoprotein
MFISKQFFIKDYTLNKDQQKISPSRSTPEVILDPKGTIKLTGRLIPENAEDFFNPIEEWINEYFKNPAEITSVEISLEYINSVGSKYLLDLIRKITHIHLKRNTSKFIINWYYEDVDENMLETGTSFSLYLDVPFNFIKII